MTSTPGLARSLLDRIRSGELDPRPAADALGLGFDQDAILGLLAAAAGHQAPAAPSGAERRDIKAPREIAEAATPGPWRWRDGLKGSWRLSPGVLIADGTDGTPGGDSQDQANAAHIATFNPSTVLALLDRVEVAERERDRAWNTARAAALDQALAQRDAAEARAAALQEALKRIAVHCWSDPLDGAYDDQPPTWAQDPLNGDMACRCDHCGSWLTVVRPGESACDTCSDGRDLAAIAAGALRSPWERGQ